MDTKTLKTKEEFDRKFVHIENKVEEAKKDINKLHYINRRNKVNRGSLWLGETWENAIKKSLTCSNDTGISEVINDKYPNKLLNTEVERIGWEMWGDGNRRRYKTRIPKRYNAFVEKTIKQVFDKELTREMVFK